MVSGYPLFYTFRTWDLFRRMAPFIGHLPPDWASYWVESAGLRTDGKWRYFRCLSRLCLYYILLTELGLIRHLTRRSRCTAGLTPVPAGQRGRHDSTRDRTDYESCAEYACPRP